MLPLVDHLSTQLVEVEGQGRDVDYSTADPSVNGVVTGLELNGHGRKQHSLITEVIIEKDSRTSDEVS